MTPRLMKFWNALLIILFTTSISHAVDLTGEFIQTNRQSPTGNLCPAPLTVQKISDTAVEVVGSISMAVVGVTPFGDEGDYIFTKINEGAQVRSNSSWITQTRTTMNNNSIVYSKKIMDTKKGDTVLETQISWYVFNDGSAILSNDTLVNQARPGLPASIPAFCKYHRRQPRSAPWFKLKF